MNIKELKVRKEELEAEIQQNLTDSLNRFNDDTGIYPDDIELTMININKYILITDSLMVENVSCPITL